MIWWKPLSGCYLAWGMGANDCANVFGPHVGSNLLSYRTCLVLFSVFVTLGAIVGGRSMVLDAGSVLPGGDVLRGVPQTRRMNLAVLVTVAAAATINIATAYGLPTSTSQGSIGAFFGLSLALGLQRGAVLSAPPWSAFGRMVASWIVSPFLAAALGFGLQWLGQKLLRRFVVNERAFRRGIRVLMLVAGAYGAYVLGASHAGVAVAPFYAAGFFESWWGVSDLMWASGLGGLFIVLGGLTYSRNVMYSVGSSITSLDPFSAFSAVVAMSLCVNVFKNLGVPVSSSQAIVGAVAGVGLTRGTRAVSISRLRTIAVGWVATPIVPALGAALMYWALRTVI